MIHQRILQKFIKKIGERLSGKWIIIGGSVLPLIHASKRYTEDIDIASPKKSSQQDSLMLMEIAQELKLPVEAINQAASFFLYRIPHWDEELVLIHRGSRGEVYRPTATLFLLLKIQRLSEIDMEDCIAMLNYAKKNKEPINRKVIFNKLFAMKKATSDKFKIKRLNLLKDMLKKDG